jgi:hypothetical protein
LEKGDRKISVWNVFLGMIYQEEEEASRREKSLNWERAKREEIAEK